MNHVQHQNVALQRRLWLFISIISKNRLLLFIFVLGFSLLAAVRFLGIDRDFYQYLYFFNDLSLPYDGRFESGFVYFSFIIKKLTRSFTVLLFFVAFFSLIVKLYLILKLPNFWYWLIIYFLMLFPLHEMTQMRAAMAIGLGYLALHLSINRVGRVLPFLLFLLAATFQSSILILLPFFLFPAFLARFDWRIFFSVVFLPVAFLYPSIEYLSYLNPMVLTALNSINEEKANPFSALNILLILIVIIGVSSAKKLPASKLPWLYLSSMGLGLWYGFMSIPVFAHRLLEITIFSYFFWIPYLPGKRRFFAMALFITLATYMFARALFIDRLFS